MHTRGASYAGAHARVERRGILPPHGTAFGPRRTYPHVDVHVHVHVYPHAYAWHIPRVAHSRVAAIMATIVESLWGHVV